MSTVLAGIDGSPTSSAVLSVAQEIARVLDASLDVVHVVEGGAEPPEVEIVSDTATPLRLLHGDVSSTLIEEASSERIAAVVIGSSGAAAPTPAGHVSLEVIGNVRKPVIVVPPSTSPDYRLRTVLVPVYGKPARALEEVVRLAENPQLHVVILRVLDETTIPAFEDQSYYDVEAWADEFLARWVPGAAQDTAMEVRIGEPHELVISVAQEVCADLVAIGRVRSVPATDVPVVSAALERSPVPVVFFPLAHREREFVSPPA